jgi:serine/threonine protein kinase/formylglycine-generating enzyme required for sulfatase activity
MRDLPHAAAESLSPSLFLRMADVCDRFADAWKTGQRPAIEDYLGSTAEPKRSLLLLELLVVELQHRGQSGETLVAEHYVSRFPAHADLIRAAFGEEPSAERSSGAASSEYLANTKPEAKGGEGEHPERLGRYRITGTLGSGGFGVVYKGYDDELRREVAIKVPHRHRVSQPEAIEAYLAEARVLASLDHPHIVPVYDAGRIDDSLCFVVSKFIEGSDLRTRIKEARPSVRESAELVSTVAEALHSAHQKRLVHRDLKPANILLDSRDKPYLADFGLALREEEFGRGGLIMGTPAYMSPEQANGEGHLVDGRSDIYSLGVVFYELLTGRRPIVVSDDLELLRLILSSTEARPPRQLDATIPRELERICLKALAKRASERYTTAFDLADDLHHWLEKTAQAPAHESSVYLKTPVRIVPKGLRSFDAQDTDFFLELLPGPRDRERLPDSIRFWKTRIEEMDPDQTFSVGLIYGPSGCGKTSLVKAGLLPRLSQDVTAVYIESTANETESRLLNGLRKRFPSLPAHLGLRATLAALRRSQAIPVGKKVLIVLDQFEQWLHAKNEEANTELMQALRQNDGGRVQCIVMVRDDFWLAISRFVRDLEVDLVPGRNIALVDLFDPDHAGKVLAAFGRAFGKLPENSSESSKEQKEFLNQAVAGLSQENKVICVRLALFAEMMKGKPWTPTSLKEVGGTQGVGVTFLEDTFSSPTANPEHRLHQKAARAVLKALLPEAGTNIRGNMRSQKDLLEASGYGSRSREFGDLIRILDSEIRLITPTDPEGKEADAEPRAQTEPGQKYYQLTHDYLVRPLRDWLTRKQKETRRGRAELLLADRASVWNARLEARQLPSFLQWLQIRGLVPRKGWTPPQRKMMRRATRYHALRGLVAVVFLALVGWTAYEGYGRLQADALLLRLLNADTNEVPSIVQDMAPYRRWLDPLLYDAHVSVAKAGNRRKQLHTSLALLPVDASQVDNLYERLLDAEPSEVLVLRDALAPNKEQLVDKLWAVVEAPGKGKETRRLRPAAALAKYDPDSRRWAGVKDQVVASMVAVQPYYLERWVEALRPIRATLVDSLSNVHRDRDPKRDPSERIAAAIILAEYDADRPRLLADLLLDSDEKQFPYLYSKLNEYGDEALTLLQDELRKPLEGIADPKAKEKLAKRQANATVAVLRMGQDASVWPMLKHSGDPTLRSYLIDRLGPLGADPGDIIQQLRVETDVEIHRALILSLGEFTDLQLPPSDRSELIEKLFALYAEDGDAGIHAAAEWLLRTWGQGERIKSVTDKLRASEAQLRARHQAKLEGTRWHVNGEGQTMVVLAGPKEFLMGSPSDGQRLVRINRTFAIGAKAVTVGEFRRRHPDHQKSESPVLDYPATVVSWYQAAEYCNWLSHEMGIEPDQWCFETDSQGQVTGLKKDYLSLTGYRLPTEAEMEFAIRAGATTSRFYGEPEELLVKYGWIVPNSGGSWGLVGRLKPNDFGLFDMHGNVWCWCLDAYHEYPGGETRLVEDKEGELTIDRQQPRVVRGSCYTDHAANVRSASRWRTKPGGETNIVGFRLARTIRRD